MGRSLRSTGLHGTKAWESLSSPATTGRVEEAVGRLLGDLERRWRHVRGVGRCAEALAGWSDVVTPAIVEAAWWHDVGYAPSVKDLGHHAIDGARYLRRRGRNPEVVSLVAWHTGAEYEAKERGLSAELADFPAPDATALDILTLIDLSVGPEGNPVRTSERLAGI